MNNIMVVFSSTDVPEGLVDQSLALAEKKNSRLIILDVRDREMSQRVAELAGNVGFMGEKVVGRLKKEISNERCDIIYRKISIIEEKAREQGIPYEIVVERGPFAKSIIKVAKKYNVRTILCQRRDHELGKGDFEIIKF